MNRKLTSALLIILMFVFGISNAQLAGNYTIGGVSPDYATVTDAVNDLNAVGISAPVVFNIRDGVYTGKVVLTAITGATFTNTVTFQSESGDSTLVTLTSPTSGSSATNYTVSLTNADYITFHQLTLERSGALAYSHVIELSGGCDYNNFTSCVITCGPVTGTSSFNALVYSAPGTADSYNIFDHNRVENGSFGFYFFGPSASVFEDGNMIMNNSIASQTNYGIQAGNQSEFMIRGNLITAASTSYGNAIYTSGLSGNSMIIENKITLPDGGTGISVQQSNGGTGAEVLVANNFVHIGNTVTTSQAFGIRINGCSNTGIYFNNVNITATVAVANNYAFNAAGTGTNLNVMNNVFVSNTGYVVGNSNNAITTMNHNDLYKGGTTNFATVNTTNYANFAAWQVATNFDTNSVNVNPLYMSATDLHIQTFALNALAVPVVNITTDIDGDLRDVATPDIGADETSPPSNDVGVTALLKPVKDGCGSSNTIVSAIVRNYAAVPQTNITVIAEVTGTQTATLTGTIAGPIDVYKSDTVYFTPALNTYLGDSLIIKLYTSILNDEDNSNDTLEIDSIYINAIPAPPVVPASVSTCLGNSASISATFPVNHQVYWFSASSGGIPIQTGNPLLVNPIDTTIYYAEVVDTTSGGGSFEDSITTNNAGGNGSSANFFDVTNTSSSPVTIHYLSTLIAGAQTATVYYLPGGLTSCTASPDIATFTMVGSAAVNGLGGAGSPFTFIPVNMNVTIPPGQTYAFCTSSPSITYTNGTGTGTCPAIASDGILSIHEGFGGTTTGPIANRRFNGVVSYSLSSGCPSDRVPVEVDVIPLPVVFLGNDTTVAAPNTVTLDAGAGFASYLWSDGSITQTIVVSASGNYTVTVTDANGCQGSDVIAVVVLTGINDFGVNSQVVLSPVPAKDYLMVTLKNMIADDYTITLLNNLGQQVITALLSVQSNNAESKFDLAGVQKGIYYVEVKSEKGISRHRVLIQ